MRIGACQTPEILGDVDAAVDTIHGFAVQATRAELDVLLFPECFLQGYLVTEPHVRDQALELGSPELISLLDRLAGIRQMLVLGIIEWHRGRYHNTALVIADGQALGAYRKTRLTSGESIFAPGDTYRSSNTPTYGSAPTHRHRSHGPSGRTHPAAHRVRSKKTGPFFIGSAIRSCLSAYRSSCTASGAPDAKGPGAKYPGRCDDGWADGPRSLFPMSNRRSQAGNQIAIR